jgi:hypothetical protein
MLCLVGSENYNAALAGNPNPLRVRGQKKEQGFCCAWSVTSVMSVMSVIEYLYP